MSKLVVPAAAALLLGAVVTELYSRLLPGQMFGLYVLTALAIFVGSYVSSLLVLRRAVPATTVPAPSRERTRRQGSSSGQAAQAKPRGAARSRPDQDAKDRQPRQPRPDRGPAPAGDRETGEVKWFNRNKGFGFIIRDAGGEIFVHQRSLADPNQRSLKDGERVSFAVVEHDKGLQAESVSTEND